MSQRRWNRRYTAAVGLFVGPAAGFLLGCRRGSDAEESKTPPVVTVHTAVVVARPFEETISAIGSVVARPGHFAALAAPGPTRVTKVLVAPGQRVAAGQTLVELDLTPFRTAEQGADAALDAALRANERAKRLADLGVGPRKDVETTAAELAKARADAANAHRTAALGVVKSPIAGIVTRMDAVLGGSVDVTQPLVEIADPSALDLVLSVAPEVAGRVSPGAVVRVAAGDQASGQPLGAGRVADVSNIVDSATRSVTIRARLPSATRPLRIGETVFATIVVATRANALAVPLAALVPDGDGFKVFVVDSSGMALSHAVVVGARTDSTAEIKSGLAAGARVVTDGAYGVVDSAHVALAGAAKPAAPRDSVK
jgi:RND family efflux transporter MFP subunit